MQRHRKEAPSFIRNKMCFLAGKKKKDRGRWKTKTTNFCRVLKEKKFPYIMNTSEDPTLLGMLLYDIKEGETKVGTKDAEENQVKINVIGIQPRHCSFFNEGGKIMVEPYPEAKLFINGTLTTKKK